MGSPIAGTVVVGIVELGKLLLQGYFQAMRMAGKSKEEMETMYQAEYTEFLTHHPDTLPDVPPDDE